MSTVTCVPIRFSTAQAFLINKIWISRQAIIFYIMYTIFKGHRKHFSKKNVKLTLFNRQTTYKNENVVYFKKYMVQEP